MLGGEEGDGGFEELMELPVSRVAEELTEEMLLKKAERNRKRRIAAQKRKEKRKVCIMMSMTLLPRTSQDTGSIQGWPSCPVLPQPVIGYPRVLGLSWDDLN